VKGLLIHEGVGKRSVFFGEPSQVVVGGGPKRGRLRSDPVGSTAVKEDLLLQPIRRKPQRKEGPHGLVCRDRKGGSSTPFAFWKENGPAIAHHCARKKGENALEAPFGSRGVGGDTRSLGPRKEAFLLLPLLRKDIRDNKEEGACSGPRLLRYHLGPGGSNQFPVCILSVFEGEPRGGSVFVVEITFDKKGMSLWRPSRTSMRIQSTVKGRGGSATSLFCGRLFDWLIIRASKGKTAKPPNSAQCVHGKKPPGRNKKKGES